MDTRERILTAALELFAANSYEAVSVRAVAEALGMTKGALYRHYKDKQDIFNAILARMRDSDAVRARAFALPEGAMEDMPEAYRQARMDQLLAYTAAQFDYWTTDALAAPFRRMLTVGQYRSGEMAELYQNYLASGPLGYLAELLAQMRPGLEPPEARALAVSLYAPVYMLMSVYDGAQDKAAPARAVREHLERFKKEWYHEVCIESKV